MGNYIDPSDIETWPSGCDAECQAKAVAFAEELVEKILHRPFYPAALDFKMDGNGKNRLFPPLHAPILTISHLYVCGVEADPCWYSWDESSVFLDMCKACPASGASMDLYMLLTAQAPEGFFPRGFDNIRMVGTYGAAEVPAPLKEAIAWLVDAVNDGTVKTVGGYQSESIGKYSYRLGATGYEKEGVYTGLPHVDKVLRHYIKQRKPVFLTP